MNGLALSSCTNIVCSENVTRAKQQCGVRERDRWRGAERDIYTLKHQKHIQAVHLRHWPMFMTKHDCCTTIRTSNAKAFLCTH